MGREDPRNVGEAQCIRLSHRGINKLGGRHEDTGNTPTFEIDYVVHTARRTTASIGERLDHQRALGGNFLTQVDRCRLGERRFLEAQHLGTGFGEQ